MNHPSIGVSHMSIPFSTGVACTLLGDSCESHPYAKGSISSHPTIGVVFLNGWSRASHYNSNKNKLLIVGVALENFLKRGACSNIDGLDLFLRLMVLKEIPQIQTTTPIVTLNYI
jgi:hypothetical protein